MVVRGGDRWPRAVGQPVRVLRRVRDVDPVRLPGAGPPLPDRLDRLHPRRRGARAGALRVIAPARVNPLVPALQNPPLLTVHVGLAVVSYGIFATSFAAGVALPDPGQGGPAFVAALAPGPGFRRLPRGDHRLPDLRDDDHPRLVVGLDRLVPLLGLGPEGDRGARHLARLRDLPPRPQPARLGGPAGGAPAGRRLRDGPRDLFRLALVHGAPRLQRPGDLGPRAFGGGAPGPDPRTRRGMRHRSHRWRARRRSVVTIQSLIRGLRSLAPATRRGSDDPRSAKLDPGADHAIQRDRDLVDPVGGHRGPVQDPVRARGHPLRPAAARPIEDLEELREATASARPTSCGRSSRSRTAGSSEHGYLGGGHIGSTTVRLGPARSGSPPSTCRTSSSEPEVGPASVRFVQTVGGRMGIPTPRPVNASRTSSSGPRSPGRPSS